MYYMLVTIWVACLLLTTRYLWNSGARRVWGVGEDYETIWNEEDGLAISILSYSIALF